MHLIDHLGKKTEAPGEQHVREALHATKESVGRVIQLERARHDYLQIERTESGYVVRYCEPDHLRRYDQTCEITLQYLKGEDWRERTEWHQWKPKKGCLAVSALFVAIFAILIYAGLALAFGA